MNETEKMMKQLNKFILNHVEDYDSVDEAVEAFMMLFNEASAKGKTFESGELTDEVGATEELEKLEFATSEREYAAILDRALKLDPDNLEARLFKLDPESLEFIHELKKLEALGKAVMQKQVSSIKRPSETIGVSSKPGHTCASRRCMRMNCRNAGC